MTVVIPIYPKLEGFVWFYHTYKLVNDTLRKDNASLESNL